MRIEVIEWDEDNVEHATRHGVSVQEIEQAIENATAARWNRRGRSGDVRIDSFTEGGRHVVASRSTIRHDVPCGGSLRGRCDEDE